jgi:hypothetical protein
VPPLEDVFPSARVERSLHGLSVYVYLSVPVILFVRPYSFVVCVRASSGHSLA